MVSVWLLAKAMPPEPLTLPVRVTLPEVALVVVKPAFRVMLPPYKLMGPAMAIAVFTVMFALPVLVALPIVNPVNVLA